MSLLEFDEGLSGQLTETLDFLSGRASTCRCYGESMGIQEDLKVFDIEAGGAN